MPTSAESVSPGGVFVALDYPDRQQAIALTQLLPQEHLFYKIGLELYLAAGMAVVDTLAQSGKKIFLDLKFHDIPNTVAGACGSAARRGISFLTIHASGGSAMIAAARESCEAAAAAAGVTPPALLAVTRLTSLPADPPHSLQLAVSAQAAGAQGVIASVWEATQIRQACGHDFLVVCPGIRLEGEAKDDQQRVSTPEAAAKADANYIVVGRPITQSPDPAAALAKITAAFRPH